jgi:hypothetical protein
MTNQKQSIIKVAIPSSPYSSDPIDFDAYVHHLCFGSTLSTLVSNTKKTGLEGRLAKDWEKDRDFKTWRFHLRSGIYDSNQEIINGNYILASFKRAFLKQLEKGSKSFVTKLKGIEKLTTLRNDIDGLYLSNINGHEIITFTFTEAIIDLDYQLSFGVYGITSSRNFNPLTGDWLQEVRLISTGPYEVYSFESDAVELRLRSNFNIYNVEKSPPIVILKKEKAENYGGFDFFRLADYQTEGLYLDDFDYYVDSDHSIKFLRFNSYFKSDSPFFYNEFRQGFIDFLQLNYFQEIDLPIGFFPLSALAPTKKEILFNDYKIKEILKSHRAQFPHRKIRVMKTVSTVSNLDAQLMLGITAFLEKYEIPYELIESDIKIIFSSFDLEWKDSNVDICVLNTSILNETPYSDIDFMFESSEGIRLPDPRKMYSQLKGQEKGTIFIEKINQFLREDAIVLPLQHFQRRFYHKKNLDFSNINIAESFVDFSLVKIIQ